MVETYFHLMWISPYIVNFGVVTCLVTSSTWMEVRRFRLPQLLWKLEELDLSSITAIKVKNLGGSYSNEEGFCSYFRMVEHGLNYEFLNINLFWKFLSVGRSSRCFHARHPSYIGIAFMDLDDTMDELEIVQFLVHHHALFSPLGLIYSTSIHSVHIGPILSTSVLFGPFYPLWSYSVQFVHFDPI